MELKDIPAIEQVDREAFGALWHNSTSSLEIAFRQAAIATVVEMARQVIGYQISTATQLGGHLARLAILPEFQGKGIGTQLFDMYEGFVSTERSEQLGGVLIKKLMNPITGGVLDVVVDRNAPSNEMWILTKDKISYYPFDPFFYERLAKTGDAVKGQVVGEYGFVVANPAWHGAIKEFSTSL